jgi:hypothetical protein
MLLAAGILLWDLLWLLLLWVKLVHVLLLVSLKVILTGQ